MREIPGFVAEASLYERDRHPWSGATRGCTPRRQVVAQRGNFGDGPDQSQLPGWFQCEGTSVNIQTCHSCFDTQAHGRVCVCYDCDRGSGKCTPGYVCTDIYGHIRPPTFPFMTGLGEFAGFFGS